jgi:hypothetical protein
MKKNQTIIVVGVALISLVFFGAALAAGKWDGAGSGFRQKGAHGRDGLAPLTRSVKQNLAISVLSDLSGQPAETVRQELQNHRLHSFLAEYSIDRQAFHQEMQAKVSALVQYLAAGAFITPEQAQQFNERIEHRSKLRSERRELMNQLIEKGLADGTITPEQAKLLQPKGFKN